MKNKIEFDTQTDTSVEIDLTGSFEFADIDEDNSDLSSGLKYEDLTPQDRRSVRKQIRKFPK